MAASTLHWHSYHAYLGQHHDRADAVILSIASTFADRVSKWFYLRDADATGPHIRVRVHSPQCDAASLEDELSAVVAVAPYQPRSTMTPLVTLPVSDNHDPFFLGLRREKYVPELDVYHGHAGVAIAEQQFVDSTSIAVRTLEAERATGFSRKSVLPRLMLDALRSSLAQPEWARFCDMYCKYWLEHGRWQLLAAGFRKKAASLAQSGVPIIAGDADLPDTARSAVRDWASSIRNTLRSYEETVPTFDHEQRTRLISELLHLLNNRLGMRVHEEAYVAVLVKQHLEQDGGPADAPEISATET